LVEQRIYQIESFQQPIFSWVQNCHPNDVNMIVYQFLRSPLKVKTFYFTDKSKEDMQTWIDEQFGRTEDMALRGFSVTAVLQQVEQECSVTVTKTPEVFRLHMAKFLDARRNLLVNFIGLIAGFFF
jgi:hypothetical protein